MSTHFPKKLRHYFYLMRLNNPIGIALLLWPTLWALWLAGKGHPSLANVTIFVLGVILMRSAGCIINDVADRHFDRHVERTRHRPLAMGVVSTREALFLFGILGMAAFALVLFCNQLTLFLSFIGLFLAIVYPFLKRVTHLPQIGLGLAFTWGIPMAFAAETNAVPMSAWVLFAAGTLWPVIYDTFYAMVDREDDRKIGVKSTAILFDHREMLMVGILQGLFLLSLMVIGVLFQLAPIYYFVLPIVFSLFVYQLYLIRYREREQCFNAFLNNNWVGATIFLGILLGTSL